MSIRFQPSVFPEGEVASSLVFPPADGVDIPRGAPVGATDGEISEFAGGATVTGIVGVALEGVTGGVPDGTADEAVVALAGSRQRFMGIAVGAAAAVITEPSTVVDVGDEFGIIKSDGVWYVDTEDVTNVVVRITGYDDNIGVVFFRFITSAVVDL